MGLIIPIKKSPVTPIDVFQLKILESVSELMLIGIDEPIVMGNFHFS
jgi:hypothetical protein